MTSPPLPGISGTITSLACAPDHVGSTSLDRFFRLHGTVSESAQKRGGQTLERVYTKSIATAVVWDPSYEDDRWLTLKGDEGEEDRVWEGMEDAEDDGDGDNEEDEGDSNDEPPSNSLCKKSRTR